MSTHLPTPFAPSPPSLRSVVRWIQDNLLNSRLNTVVTLIFFPIIGYVVIRVADWVLFGAQWEAVTKNLNLFLVGQYPSTELWRIGVIGLIGGALAGASWAVWGGIARTFTLAFSLAVLAAALLPIDIEGLGLATRAWYMAVVASVAAGFAVARYGHLRPRPLTMMWAFSPLVVFVLLRGMGEEGLMPHVSTNQWGGLLLTFVLAIVGIVASFPLGVLLALGRRSRLPVVKGISVLFIESIRAVPLVTLLFMMLIIVPLLLPEGWRLDRAGRALLAITIFSAAYMAENVRGGLDSVPIGQTEAAKAVGLGNLQTMMLIVLPQALRNVIPAIVGQFITLFKDTTLVVIVGLLDILGMGKAIVLGNVEYITAQAEVYLFIGAAFWVFTFSMSYASRRVERALGVGTR